MVEAQQRSPQTVSANAEPQGSEKKPERRKPAAVKTENLEA
jgi:hypothetical protein